MVQIRDLEVIYPNGFSLKPIDLNIAQGEILSIVGESGSGKTTFGKSVARVLDKDVKVKGQVLIKDMDIYNIPEETLRHKRMRDFAICLQNSQELFNPLLTIEEQLFEVLKKAYEGDEIKHRMKELLCQVGLDESVLKKYPRQLSGGMLQKILIIKAIGLNPKFVILDEPTSSLDKESKEQIISLIKETNRNCGTSFLVITHDLTIARILSHRMMILYGGKVMEIGDTTKVLNNPRHPYTRGLINSSMDLNPYRDIWGIRSGDGEEQTCGCPFFHRCNQKLSSCRHQMPKLKRTLDDEERMVACNRDGIVKVLSGKNLVKSYDREKVIQDVNIDLMAGEVVSLIGESGVGKTTLSKILGGFLEPDNGEILFEGRDANFRKLHRTKGGLQMVFQDPTTSINPNMKVIDAVSEPLRLSYMAKDYMEEAKRVLKDVGLSCGGDILNSKVRHLSGGQKQKLAVARALIMEPKVLLADEPTSMLDSSSKANLLRLLKEIQNTRGFSMLIITHDIASAIKISDRIYLLCNESGILEFRGEQMKELGGRYGA